MVAQRVQEHLRARGAEAAAHQVELREDSFVGLASLSQALQRGLESGFGASTRRAACGGQTAPPRPSEPLPASRPYTACRVWPTVWDQAMGPGPSACGSCLPNLNPRGLGTSNGPAPNCPTPSSAEPLRGAGGRAAASRELRKRSACCCRVDGQGIAARAGPEQHRRARAQASVV